MTMLASQITSLPVVCSIVYSDVNQRKHQSSASLAFVREIHRGPVNFPHKWPVTRKMFPFDDVIMYVYVSSNQLQPNFLLVRGGGWGCEVSCGGHHRPRGKTTTGSALDGAVFDIAQILAYLVHNMSRSQLYLGFGHFGWLSSFFGQ